MIRLKDQIRLFSRVQWILAGVTGAVLLAFFIVGYLPASRQLSSLQADITAGEAELLASQDQAVRLPDVAAHVDRLNTRLKRFKRLPSQPELPEFLRQVTQIANQLSLRKFEHRREVSRRGALFNEEAIKFSFTGDFLNVYSFLRQMEELPRLMRVRSLKLQSVNGLIGQVSVEMTVMVYYSES